MGAVAAWTGQRLLIWGGETGRTSFVATADGLAFDARHRSLVAAASRGRSPDALRRTGSGPAAS